MNPRFADSILAFLVGYASILNLCPMLRNPASLHLEVSGQSVKNEDFVAVGLDWAQVSEDTKLAFQRLADEMELEPEAA